jgi:glycosyltransferase involved in cell wall biosynthesis
MKRVMVVTNSLSGGGAERSMNLISNELTLRGWSIALVPINSGPPDLVRPNCQVFPLNREWQGSTINTIKTIWKFNKLVWKWQPDAIVLNCDLPELFGATLFSRKKLIAIEHIDRPWSSRIFLGLLVRKVLRARKTTWAAVSGHLTIWPEGKEPSEILMNSVLPLTIYRESSPVIPKKFGILRLLFVGRLVPQKRPDWVLEIAMRSKLPVRFVGDGVMKTSLEGSSRAVSLDAEFYGQALDPWGASSPGDLLVVPSLFEGDGLVVVEGIQHSLPLLLADIPEFRRFNFPDVNYCKDISDFVDTIDLFREKLPELLIPSQISESILATRSSLAIGDSWEKFLDSI